MALMKGRSNKYGAARVTYKGETFDSYIEMKRWLYLQLLVEDGRISDLRRQVRYELLPAWTETVEKQLKTKTVRVTRVVKRAVVYVADFVYMVDGKTVVEDVKGVETPVYKLKEHMMHSLLGIDIRVVRRAADGV